MIKRITVSFIIITFSFLNIPVYALPQGGSVSPGNGTATLNYSGNNLTVNQSSDRLIADWNRFSIDSSEAVAFVQPNTSSIALNRVTGVDPSSILGTLTANGRIFLINPNGVMFGVGSVVDTAGLVVSTLNLDMSDAAFMAGGTSSFSFTGPGGSIVNYGTLTAPGGYVSLLGSSVKNAGTITANLGKVVLAAGEKMALDLDPAGLISVVVDVTQGTDRNDNAEYAAVNNVGTITADGGQVILTAKVLGDVFDSAVNNDGMIEANTLEEVNGQVLLNSNQNIELNGTIVASGSIDAYAQDNIYLGRPIDDFTLSIYDWEYLRGDRAYQFREFGYYYEDGSFHTVLSQGVDIGKDITSPTSGNGYVELPGQPIGLYAVFEDYQGQLLTFYEDPALNPDGLQHINITGSEYAWEDQLFNGDQDFNDVVIDFQEDLTTIETPDALLNAPDIFLTADNGFIEQESGDIIANNLMLESNTGVSGTGSNGGLATQADHLSALNKSLNDIRVSNAGTLTIADLSAVNGLNNGVTGFNGVTNNAPGGVIDIEALEVPGQEGPADPGDLNVEAPVDSYGPVIFTADNDIIHTAAGDVTIHNVEPDPNPPVNLHSPTHAIGEVPDGSEVEADWELPESEPGYGFTGTAGGSYTMAEGSQILTNGGNADVTAEGDISLALIDARNANVKVTSNSGSILDADLGTVPGDYDVIGHNIRLSAPMGTVGTSGDQEEIDLGYPYRFSLLWDNIGDTNADLIPESYKEFFDPESGDWSFSATSDPLSEGSWWFHVATIKGSGEGAVSSTTEHLGPFTVTPPPPPPPPPPQPTPEQLAWEEIEKELKVYYEILNPSQFLSYEPATQIGLYAYHPLTPTDSSAFDNIRLDINAYEFISGNLNVNKASPYFGINIPDDKK